jgi:hypothetical protein
MHAEDFSILKGPDLTERSADHRPSVSSLKPERLHTDTLEFEVFALFCLTRGRLRLTCSLYKDSVLPRSKHTPSLL